MTNNRQWLLRAHPRARPFQDGDFELVDSPRPVVFDCRVEKNENCLPMIPSGKAHNEMILPEDGADIGSVIDEAGRRLV